MALELEVGKSYLNIGGDIVTIVARADKGFYNYKGDNGQYYTSAGFFETWDNTHHETLVKEIKGPALFGVKTINDKMSPEEYIEFHKNACDKMHDITQRKNADYTGDSGDPFKNFRGCEYKGVASTEAGIWTRMDDKMSRIATFISKGAFQVKDESVEDTCLDLANYAIILAAVFKEKKRGSNES